MILRGLTAALLAALFTVLSFADGANAQHDLFAYKFPCRPADACYVTTLDHPVNALDFDPQGSAGLGDIIVASEGTFQGYITDSTGCTWPDGSGLGRSAVITDVHGRTLQYGHLSSFGNLQVGARVQQGDKVGVEGNTGFSANCAPHLHLKGVSTAAGINGIAMSSITAGPTLYSSTNSTIGAFTLGGAAIRSRYNLPAALGGSSWNNVGWTHSVGGQGGCNINEPPVGVIQNYCTSFCFVPNCRLQVHYYPLVANGHWGSVQTFRLHPDAGGNGNNGLTWHRWSAANPAYRVDRANNFFNVWLKGGVVEGTTSPFKDVGLPVMDRLGNYQKTHVGYVKFQFPYTVAHFCPDIDGGQPGPGDFDFSVSGSDFFALLGAFGATDSSLAPYQVWPNSWYDLDGNGAVAGSDFLLLLSAFGLSCAA